MRLMASKVYRAFPELDQFDDAACERFVRGARRQRSLWSWLRGVVVSLVIVAAASVVSVMLMVTVTRYVSRIRTPLETTYLLGTAAALSFSVGAPFIAVLVLRDQLLRRAVREILKRTHCLKCRYPLLGIPIHSDSVRCPECGEVAKLDELDGDAAASIRAAAQLAMPGHGDLPSAGA